jgi:hypothetical protein
LLNRGREAWREYAATTRRRGTAVGEPGPVRLGQRSPRAGAEKARPRLQKETGAVAVNQKILAHSWLYGCRRNIEMSLGAQSRDDIPGGGEANQGRAISLQ